MNIIQKSYRTLEFDIILDQIAAYAHSANAKERIVKLEPFMDEQIMLRHVQDTTMAKLMLESNGNPPIASVDNTKKLIDAVHRNQLLMPEQFVDLRRFIAMCKRLKTYLGHTVHNAEAISSYGLTISVLAVMESEIDQCIHNSQVSDDASDKLSTIRRKLTRKNESIRSRMDILLQKNRSYYSDHYVTLKHGRYTLPVKKEFKNRVPGSVVDISKSGNTCFIEPAFVQKMQSEISQLRAEEDQEVRCILYILTAQVEDAIRDIQTNVDVIEEIDYIFAKAKYSKDRNCTQPLFNHKNILEIKNGRHPLLNVDEVVPLNFYLGDTKNDIQSRGIIVTGPNTGGKTVTLKTVGLFSLMAQSGLHVPAERCNLSMRSMVLCDIGDGQDISENLSTFSSHMTNIIEILQMVDQHSLVLLDELGSGTDPLEGMGLAAAILQELNSRSCQLVVTTHYPQIKVLASDIPEFVNARMQFDQKSLLPTYQLEIGTAGNSCALYIAHRLGLPTRLIRTAENFAYHHDEFKVFTDESSVSNLPEQTLQHHAQKPRLLKIQQPSAHDKIKEQFAIGDSVVVEPGHRLGIISNSMNKQGEFGVRIQEQTHYINHKRIQLKTSAEFLYPENYDMSIVLESTADRKTRKKMSKRHIPDACIVLKEDQNQR